jgi:hypothetical protein
VNSRFFAEFRGGRGRVAGVVAGVESQLSIILSLNEEDFRNSRDALLISVLGMRGHISSQNHR